MSADWSKKVKKRLSKYLLKDEQIFSKYEEIVSEIQKIKTEYVRRPSDTYSDLDEDRESIYPSIASYSSSISNDDFENASGNQLPAAEIQVGEKTPSCAGCVSNNMLSRDFLSMLEIGYFADVSIKCGSDVLKAHKCVLSARSPVFEAMFSSSMQESATDTVVIDEIDPVVFQAMLTFMYSGQVHDLDVTSSCDLLYAADKYQVDALKRFCVQFLKCHLTVENSLHILEVTDLYDEPLKRHVMNFISKQFNIIKVSTEWTDMQTHNPALALEVYSNVVDTLQKRK